MSPKLGYLAPLPLEKEGSFAFALSFWEKTILSRVFFSPSLRARHSLWDGVGTSTDGGLGEEGAVTEPGGMEGWATCLFLEPEKSLLLFIAHMPREGLVPGFGST